MLNRLDAESQAHALEVLSLDKNHAMANVPGDLSSRKPANKRGRSWEVILEVMTEKLQTVKSSGGHDFLFDEIHGLSVYSPAFIPFNAERGEDLDARHLAQLQLLRMADCEEFRHLHVYGDEFRAAWSKMNATWNEAGENRVALKPSAFKASKAQGRKLTELQPFRDFLARLLQDQNKVQLFLDAHKDLVVEKSAKDFIADINHIFEEIGKLDHEVGKIPLGVGDMVLLHNASEKP